MRPPLAALALIALALPLLAGCVEPPPTLTPVPMVLLEEHLTLDPPVAGLLERARPLCDAGSYALDPPRAGVHHGLRGIPDFLMVVDSTTAPDVDGGRVFALMSSSGDGSAWDWTMRATFGDMGGSSAFGLGTPFRDGPPDGLTIGWRDGRAWLDGTPLEEGEPIERRLEYDIRGPDGDVVHVVHEWRATFLGHGLVMEAPPTCDPQTGRPLDP